MWLTGFRRGVPVDAVYRQAHEGAHSDAGDRPGKPRLSGQGSRLDRRLQRDAAKPARCARAVRIGDDGTGDEEIVAPIEERVQALLEAIEATEAHLRGLGFDPAV